MRYHPTPVPLREVAQRAGVPQKAVRAYLATLGIELPVRDVPPLEGVFVEVLVEHLRRR